MKKCPICGKIYEKEMICPTCGMPLIDTETENAVKTEPEKTSFFGIKKKEEKKQEEITAQKTEKETFGESKADDNTGKDSELSEEYNEIPDRHLKEYDEQVEKQEELYGVGGSRKQSPPPDMEQRCSDVSEKNKVTISFNPVYVAIGAVILCLIIAVVFIMRGRAAKKEAEQLAAQKQAYEMQQENTAKDEPKETQDLSDVDVNVVDDPEWEYTGEVINKNARTVLKVDKPLNFYAYNTENEETILKNVREIVIDDENGEDISDYAGATATVRGYLTVDGNQILMEVIEVESEEMDDLAIHNYQVIISDISWEQAEEECERAGGYLARINSEEEFNYIINMLNNGGYTKNHFYLGGRRDSDGQEYYWVKDDEFMEECINDTDSWAYEHWYDNEPSYEDVGADADGRIEEDVMNLFFVNGTWYFNDSSDDLAGDYPDLLTGKVGYIMEIE